MLAVLAEHGHHDLTAEHLDLAFDGVLARFDAAWAANRQYTAHHAAEHAIEALERTFGEAERDALARAYLDAAVDLEVALAPNVVEVLATLRHAGIRLGIICDVGLTPSTVLRRYLARHEVLDLFDHWSFSDEVGVYKPDPAIFRHALDGLDAPDPTRVAHVGDLRRTDVAGARGVGEIAVRYRGVHDDDPVADAGDDPVRSPDRSPDAEHVVDDHVEVLSVLGLDG
jgi:putative hydrolase of the HAD superfamily